MRLVTLIVVMILLAGCQRPTPVETEIGTALTCTRNQGTIVCEEQ